MRISRWWITASTPSLLLCVALSAAKAQAPSPKSPPEPTAEPRTESSEEELPSAKYEDEITVARKAEPSLTAPSPELVEAKLDRVPGGTNFIDAASYETGRVSTLKDALDFAPGVFVQPRFGAEEARLSIRGSGLQRTFHGRGLKLLQDGVPLNLADGGFDFQAVEPLAARSIEIYRGANALELGASTLGGAINFISKSAFDSQPLQVRTEAGSFDYLRGQLSAGFTGANLDGYLTLSHFSQDGFRDHSEQSTQRLLGNLGYRASDTVDTRFYFAAFRSDSELPGSLTKAQLNADASLAAANNLALGQKRDFELFRFSNRTSVVLDADRRLDLGAFYSYKHLDHPIFQVLDQRSNDLGLDARYEAAGTLAGRSHRLVVGLSPVVGTVEDNRFRNVRGERGERTAAGDTTSTNVELYAEDRLELTALLTLAVGAQATYGRREFEDRFLSDGNQTDVQSFDGLSPKLGLLYSVAPSTSLFANLSRSFEPPSFGELVNVGGGGLLALDAQTATTLEIGSRGRANGFAWDLSFYHARVDDELLSLNDPLGNPLGTINAERTVHTGAEIGLEARTEGSWGALALRQVYNWSRFEFDGDRTFGDHRLAGVPEHFLRTELLFERGRIYAGPNLERVTSSYPVDHAGSLFADPYTVLGAKLGYRAERGLGVFLEGRNLTDETYSATTGVIADARGRDSAQFLPGDGRSFFVGFDYRR